MKCTIPEISWHNRVPVLSVDFQNGVHEKNEKQFWRLASGGCDSHVLVWHLTVGAEGEASVVCVADLERHQKTVNVVRFSPSGEILASGDDESVIILWKQREGSDNPILPQEDGDHSEQWNSWKVFRGHIEDIYDLCWSPDSATMASVSLDNSVIFWNIEKGKKICMVSDYHKGFPQGVAWDPLNKSVATLSSDRLLRLISVASKKTISRVSKSKIPTPPGNPLEGKIVRLFYDDTFKSFFRRLTYSPDGNLIIAPSGIIEPQEPSEKTTNSVVIFSSHDIKEPLAILPTHDEVSNAVKCCPTFFKLRENGPESYMKLPYRMVFAVATDNSVIIYDTQQDAPIAIISNIHYTRLTDLAWSSDGRVLVASSSDGYCSIVHFQAGELGEVYEMPSPVKPVPVKSDDKDDNKNKSTVPALAELDINAVDTDLLQNKIPSNKNQLKDETKTDQISDKDEPMDTDNDKENPKNNDNDDDFQLVLEDTVAETEKKVLCENDKKEISKNETEEAPCINKKDDQKDSPAKSDKPPLPLTVRTPRRVELITLSSPKQKIKARAKAHREKNLE
ncbi:chromatin assembly factor 1 subunit B [Trichogramma pretiosum]|uniref:chromatin assembly factor 1 subunit B n=1 Tax=Trichogramma pretiosum TaxID=7493 RepID=UPI0006C968FB|nr:chromatin assembly factor 1 subunit B [Trichogramma pretiosum]